MRESEIIALFFSREDRDATSRSQTGAARALQPNDDCARIDARTIVTTDAIVEGTHFRGDWSGPEDLAIKLWNVNLSDIAASGGDPDWCLLNLGLPTNTGDDWLRAFALRFRRECEGDGGRLVGGDTFRAENITLSLTLAGRLWRPDAESESEKISDAGYRYLERSGAAAGDAIYITGAPGLSLLGYELLKGDGGRFASELSKRRHDSALYRAAIDRHLRPRARLDWSRLLRSNLKVGGMLDLSDGLHADLLRLAEANPELCFRIDCERLPLPGVDGAAEVDGESPSISAAAIQAELEELLNTGVVSLAELRRLALGSGEELELLFSAPPGLAFDFPCTAIGRIVPASADDGAGGDSGSEQRVRLQNAPAIEGGPQQFQHF